MTTRQRYRAALVVLPLVSFWVSGVVLSGTWEAVERLHVFRLQVEEQGKTARELERWERETRRLEEVLRTSSSVDSVDLFFSTVSAYCRREGIVLRDYPAAHRVQQGAYVCRTRVVTLEAGFHRLLYLVEAVERRRTLRLRALSFEKIRGNGRAAPAVRLKLYVQTVGR